jgi:hypothetical protein
MASQFPGTAFKRSHSAIKLPSKSVQFNTL